MPKTHVGESPEVKSLTRTLADKPHILLLTILLVALAAYSNTFGVPFQFDDTPNIVQNEQIKHLSEVPSLFSGSQGPFASRPLMHATLALNYYFGGFDTRGYHAVNLALHLANGILLYLLVLLTGRHLGRDEKEVRVVALFSSLIFSLHPVQTEAVTYIISRSMLLAAMFYFSGMILFLRAATVERGRGFWIAGLLVVSLLGMASRENFATFPVMLVLYDMFFVSRFKAKTVMRHWMIYLPVFLSLGYMAFIVATNTYDRGADYPGVGLSSVDYLLTQFNVHWTYLRLFILPVDQNIEYEYPVAKSLLEFPTIISFLGYLGLWAAGIVSARRRPVISYSLLWFLVTLLPISFGVVFMDLRLDDVIFEHRLYLSSAGLAVLAAVALTGLLARRKALVPVLAAVVLALGSAAYARNALWADGSGLWEDAVRKSPRKARAHLSLGFAYESKGLIKEAEEQYKVAVRLEPEYFLAHINLGNIYMAKGQHEEAIRHFSMAVFIRPASAAAYNSLANAYHMNGQASKAEYYFREAIRIERMMR